MTKSPNSKTRSFFQRLVLGLLLVTMLGCKLPDHESPIIDSAVDSRNQFFHKDGRQIAYRTFGLGAPIILCNRFRGTLDDWDPMFLDGLAEHFTVTIFDYSGIGLSTLKNPADSLQELEDINDLAEHLGLSKFSLLGWSHGGKVSQVYTAKNPDRVISLILLGTGPLGKNALPPEQIFFDRALKPVNDFEDEVILFFEPARPLSVEAARSSHERIASRKVDKDVYVTPEKFGKYFQTVAVYNADIESREKLNVIDIPILALSGDHDIVFPIENWYALTRENKNLQIVMLPQAGHGPQSQYPLLCSRYITNFIEYSSQLTNHTTAANL